MIDSNPSDLTDEREMDLLPARMLNEFVYCPRLFYLEHSEGLFQHNEYTRQGASLHRRVDEKTDELKKAPARKTSAKARDESDREDGEPEKETIHARSVTLASEMHGIIAKLDLIEAEGNVATPVDYKRGAPKKLEDGSLDAWDPERVQICAQALVLRENGYQCDEGVIFFWKSRQRVRIPIDEALIAQTEQAIRDARQTAAAGVLPEPLRDSPKCPSCSLVSICLPDESHRCRDLEAIGQDPAIQPLLFDVGSMFPHVSWPEKETSDQLRQLVTPRDDKRPLYLNSQRAKIGKTGELLTVKEKETIIQKIRLFDINQVNLFGNVQVTTQAVQSLLQAEIPLVYFSYGGWFHGMTQSVGLKNIMWRREQFRMADDSRFCLSLARELVVGKIRNQRTLLMRNHIEPPKEALQFLKALGFEASLAESQAKLLGIEGLAARVYFEQFSGMIKIGDRQLQAMEQQETGEGSVNADNGEPASCFAGRTPIHRFDFRKRNRRPPRDPVNALLSLGYSLLAKDLTIACAATGLDPFLGYYHQPRFGRPALALDLMEPFRPLIVDSAVISAINQRMVTERDFVSAGDAVALTPGGRKGFFRAYEQRMDQLVTHPLFGYRVSYRRLLDIQTRLLARVLLGEIRSYPVFVTR